MSRLSIWILLTTGVEIDMVVVSLIASLMSLAVSLYILSIVRKEPEAKGFTKAETNQLRQILNVMAWDGDIHEN